MKKILIIEDNADINGLIAEALKKGGYEYRQAFSGTEGLLCVSLEKFDLAVMDLMLPGMRGEELLPKLREKQDIPVIVLSAMDGLDSKLALLESGADDYMTKPFEVAELIARVGAHLRKHAGNGGFRGENAAGWDGGGGFRGGNAAGWDGGSGFRGENAAGWDGGSGTGVENAAGWDGSGVFRGENATGGEGGSGVENAAYRDGGSRGGSAAGWDGSGGFRGENAAGGDGGSGAENAAYRDGGSRGENAAVGGGLPGGEPPATSRKLFLKNLVLDFESFSVQIDGVRIPLTRQEFKIMELLLSNPRRVFSKQDIYSFAWDDYYMGEDKTINMHISNIRRKLKAVSEEEYIETVWGIGFKAKTS